jgi:hypothetical protein
MTWREKARPVIKQVIKEVGTDDMKALRRALSKAYPFWGKENYPYKVWLDEIKRQLKQPPYDTPKPSRQAINQQDLEQAGQQRLFA